jgi:hypothetical protein
LGVSAGCRFPRFPICLVVTAGLLTGGHPLDAQPISGEARLKAAFVFQFAQWTVWPARALEGRPALEYCVGPTNPFGTALRDLTAGELIGGRPLVVREVTLTTAVTTCHVLFVSGSSSPSLLERVAGQPVLTVGDSPRFLNDGGIIQLIRVGNNLRFHISPAAAERAGLRLSSHLLELAENLRRGGS